MKPVGTQAVLDQLRLLASRPAGVEGPDVSMAEQEEVQVCSRILHQACTSNFRSGVQCLPLPPQAFSLWG